MVDTDLALDLQVYARRLRDGRWAILLAPMPCRLGDGQILELVTDGELGARRAYWIAHYGL